MGSISDVAADLPRKGGIKMLLRGLDWVLRPSRPAGQRYAFAFIAALLAILLNWATWPWVRELPYFVPFTMALLALVYGGFGPALITGTVSFINTDFFLLNPSKGLSVSFAFRLLIVLVHLMIAHTLRMGWVKEVRLKKEAEVALNARDQFMSVAAHELLTPITAMKLQVQLLLRRGISDPLMASKLNVLNIQMDRLVDLSTHLLDVSRITADKMQFDPQEVDLSVIAAEVVGRNEALFQRAGCEMVMELQPAVLGVWDQLRVEQILINLLSNACKYGDGKPIVVRTRCDGVSAYLEVEDHGIGISSEDRKRIFEQFERAVSGHAYSGLGLGLWIVNQIVMAMGGAVNVHSMPNSGSTFIIKLPRYFVAESKEAPLQRKVG